MGERSAFIGNLFRINSREFLLQLEQARNLIKKHNLYLGLVCEEVLRKNLCKFLPKKYRVSQGFVEFNGLLSRQCDVIIYDCDNYSPVYSFGAIEIIPAEAVKIVIEVKTSMNKRSFCSVLNSFVELRKMGIEGRYVFAFSAPKIKTIREWFYEERPTKNCEIEENKDQFKDFYIGESKYDVDDIEFLPKGILILNQDTYLGLDHVQTETQDLLGYNEYYIEDEIDKKVSCFQSFICSILGDINGNESNQNSFEIKSNYLSIKTSFGLCSM